MGESMAKFRAKRAICKARCAAAGRGFLNMLNNYLKYNPKYGHVVIGMYVFLIAFLGYIIGLLSLMLFGIITIN